MKWRDKDQLSRMWHQRFAICKVWCFDIKMWVRWERVYRVSGTQNMWYHCKNPPTLDPSELRYDEHCYPVSSYITTEFAHE